jgi:CRP-like cAMP-binding protein
MTKGPTSAWARPRNVSCFTCRNKEGTEWCVLEPKQLEILDRAKITKTYREGESIYHQGDPCLGIYCVESGNVSVRMTNAQGGSKIVRFVHPGQTLGYSDFFAERGYRGDAVCLEPTTICFIPKEPLKAALHHNPNLGLAFLNHATLDLQEADSLSMNQALYPVRTQVAHLLLNLKDNFGTVGDDGVIEITLPMSWQDVSELIGARPETVSRAVHVLIDDGVIDATGRKVIIRDLDKLFDEIETGAS